MAKIKGFQETLGNRSKQFTQVNPIKRIFIYSLAVKLIFAAILPLMSDEAYYWVWSHHLQLGYFDHPAAISWMIYLGKALPMFMVRWPAVILAHIGFFYFLKANQFLKLNDDDQLKWAFLFLVFPLTGFGGVFITPDLSLLTLLGPSYYFFLKSLYDKKLKYYALFGLCFGLGLSSKYHMILFGSVLFAFSLFNREIRQQLNPIGFLVATVLAFVGFAPTIIWNYQNNWASFLFQAQHGLGHKEWNVKITLAYLAGQAIFLTPFLWRDFYRRIRSKNFSLELALGLFPLVFFFLSSLRKVVQMNWTNLAFPFLFLVLVQNQLSWKRIKLFCAFYSFLYLIVFSHWITPWIPGAKDKLNEPHEYSVLLKEVESHNPIYLGSYQMASKVYWLTQKEYFKLPGIRRFDFFDQLKTPADIENEFYVIKEYWVSLPDWIDASYSIELNKKITEDFELWHIKKTKEM